MSSTTTCDSCDTTVATTSPAWIRLSREKKPDPEKRVDPLLLALRHDYWDACGVRCAHALLDGPLDRGHA